MMWKFKSKKSQREYEVLKEIFINSNSLSVIDIASKFNIEMRSAKTIIDEINSNYSFPKMYINDNYLPIQVFSYDIHDVRKGINQFYSNVLELEILEYIFVHYPIHKDKVCEVFFVSDSTLERIIKSIRSNLNNIDLTVKGGLIYFEGDKTSLLNFFVQYFYEKGSSQFIKNIDDYRKTFFSLFQLILNDFNMNKLQFLFNYYQWVYLCILILLSKNEIKLELNQKINESDFNDTLKSKHADIKIYKYFSDNIKRLFLIDESVDIISPFLFFFEKVNFEINAGVIDLESSRKLIDDLNGNFSMSLNSDTISLLSNYLSSLVGSYYGRAYFLFNLDFKIYHEMLNQYPNSMNILYMNFKDYFSNLNLEVTEDRIINTIMSMIEIIPNLSNYFMKLESKKEVFIYFVSSFSDPKKIITLLETYFDNVATFTLIPNFELIEGRTDNKKIITDVPIFNDDNILYIDQKLIWFELLRIEKFIHI